MTQLLNALFSSLTPLWEMSVTAAFVAVVVVLLRLVLKNRAPRQVVCLLWLLVFTRLLLPISLESPVSMVPSALTEQTPVAEPAPEASAAPEATLPVTTAPPVTVTQSVEVIQPPIVNEDPAPAVSTPVVQAPSAEDPAAEATFPWQALAAGVWAAGFGAMLGYGIWSSLAVRRRVRFAVRTEDGVWEEPHLRSPFILGLFRPKIYLPCGLTGEMRNFILCHEHAHLRRRDHVVKPICWLALTLHWFNPAAWVAFLLMSRDMEVACDQSVLRRLGTEVKADYSATLLALATNGRFPAPTPLAFGEGDAKTRIKGVLNFKKPALWVTIGAVVIAIAAAVCLLTDPVAKFDPSDYTTDRYYPGLYFKSDTDRLAGTITNRVYKLVNGKPVLVGGTVQDGTLYTLIHPDGTTEDSPRHPTDVAAALTQYLVDAMLEMDPNWVADTLTLVRSVASETQQDTTALYYAPNGSLLLLRAGQVQVLPLYGNCADNPLTHAAFDDLDGDGAEELFLVWKDTIQGSVLVCDYMAVCEWDGSRWSIHPGNFWAAEEELIYEKMGAEGVNIYYGDKLLGTIDSPDNYDNYLKTVPGALTVSDIDVSIGGDGSPVACYTVYLVGDEDQTPLFCLYVSMRYQDPGTAEDGLNPFVVTGMEVAEATSENTEPAPSDPYGTPTTPVVLQNSDGISVDLDGDGTKEILTTQSSTNSAGAAEYELLTVTGSAGTSTYDSYDLPITFDRSGFTLTPHPEEGTVEVAMDGISGRIPVDTDAFQYAGELVLYNRVRYDNFIWADGMLYLRSTAYIAYHDSDAPTGYITVGALDLLYRMDCQSGDGAFTPTLVSIYPGCSDLTYWAADFVKMSNASYAECGMTLLALLPEEGLYLYENSPGTKNYLRCGGYITELDTSMDGWSFEFSPGDYNGDGRTETVLLYHKAHGTGCNEYGLMACWVNENGLQTAYHTPSDLFSPFNENNSFSYHAEDNTLSLTYGGKTLQVRLPDSYADLSWDTFGDSAVVCGEQVYYTANGNGTFTLGLPVGVTDDGVMIHYTPIQLAATVTFDGRQFTTGSATLSAQADAVMIPFTVTPVENSLVDDVYTQFELEFNGETIPFSGTHLKDDLEPGDTMLTYYLDMTGDGVADPMVFLIPGYGTGPIKYDVHIFDGVTLEKCDTSDLWSLAAEPYTFTTEGDTYYISAYGSIIGRFTKEDALAYYADYPAYSDISFLETVELWGTNCDVTVKNGALRVVFDCMIGDYWQHYGDVETTLTLTDGALTVATVRYVYPDGTTGSASTPVLSAPFAAVLQNTATFLSEDTGTAIYLNEIARAIAPYETFDIVPESYALVDLDGDGIQEMLLDLPISAHNFYGYLILHYETGTVYGYTRAVRQFDDVRVDGTSWYSESSASGGIARLTFNGGELEQHRITYREEVNGVMHYYVNGARATEAEFDAALEEWHRMTPVTWVSLSDDLLPSGDPVSYFQGLLSPAADNCYAGALTSVFSTPAEMDLSQVFYNTGESTRLADLTAGEQAFLTEHGFTRMVPIQKRPADALDAALREYFGITLDQISPDSWSDLWVYYPETDCYYSTHGDVNFLWPLTVTKVTTIQPTGLIEVYYEIDEMLAFDGRSTHMVLTLREKTGGGYTLVSNLPQQSRILLTAGQGEDLVLFGKRTNGFYLLWDGEYYSVADLLPPSTDWNLLHEDDFDNDGQTELFLLSTADAHGAETTMATVFERANGQLSAHTYDTYNILNVFMGSTIASYNEATGHLTLNHYYYGEAYGEDIRLMTYGGGYLDPAFFAGYEDAVDQFLYGYASYVVFGWDGSRFCAELHPTLCGDLGAAGEDLSLRPNLWVEGRSIGTVRYYLDYTGGSFTLDIAPEITIGYTT